MGWTRGGGLGVLEGRWTRCLVACGRASHTEGKWARVYSILSHMEGKRASVFVTFVAAATWR